MPELPDLTVFAENLTPLVTGRRIIEAVAKGADLKSMAGAAIDRVERAGKQLSFHLDNGDRLFVHLMLTGGFIVEPQQKNVSYEMLRVIFADSSMLVVTDPKGWAKVSLNAAEGGGVDALEVTGEDLSQLCRKKPRMLIKALLIDQKLITGIGNAYADEILWEARISPKSVAGKIPAERIAALAGTIPAVLQKATVTLRERHPGIVAGEFREFLAVHGPTKKSSPTGHPIRKEQVASKTTYYTDEQIEYL